MKTYNNNNDRRKRNSTTTMKRYQEKLRAILSWPLVGRVIKNYKNKNKNIINNTNESKEH